MPKGEDAAPIVVKGENAAPIEIIDAEIGEFTEFDIGEAI